MTPIKDKSANIMCTIAILIMYINGILNQDFIYVVIGNQLLIFIYLLDISNKVGGSDE